MFVLDYHYFEFPPRSDESPEATFIDRSISARFGNTIWMSSAIHINGVLVDNLDVDGLTYNQIKYILDGAMESGVHRFQLYLEGRRGRCGDFEPMFELRRV